MPDEISIAIAEDKLRKGNYKINIFFYAFPTIMGSDKMYLDLNQEIIVAILKIKGDWFLPEETKYIILHERNILLGEYPNVIDHKTAKLWLVSKKENGKRVEITDTEKIEQLQSILAKEYGIY